MTVYLPGGEYYTTYKAIITVPYSLAQRKMCREYYYNKSSYGINEKRVDPERSEIDK
jgi:hypothetical protein